MLARQVAVSEVAVVTSLLPWIKMFWRFVFFQHTLIWQDYLCAYKPQSAASRKISGQQLCCCCCLFDLIRDRAPPSCLFAPLYSVGEVFHFRIDKRGYDGASSVHHCEAAEYGPWFGDPRLGFETKVSGVEGHGEEVADQDNGLWRQTVKERFGRNKPRGTYILWAKY